ICGNPYGCKPQKPLIGRYLKWFMPFILLMAMVGPAMGISLTFQDYSDFNQHVSCLGTGCYWVQSSTGGNSYIAGDAIRNRDPLISTYAAATIFGSTGYDNIYLFDSSLNIIGQWFIGPKAGTKRYEVVIS